MPVDFTLPPDTRAVGTGNPPQDVDNIVDALTASGTGYNVCNAVFAGGADPTGVADSTAAFQAAILAATGTASVPVDAEVIIPPGAYTVLGPLNLTGPVRIRGLGGGPVYFGGALASAVTITSANTVGLFKFPSQGYLWGGFEIENVAITMTSTGNAFHLLNFSDSLFRNVSFTMTSAAAMAVYTTGSVSALNLMFERCYFTTTQATRTSPMVSISASGGAAISNNTFWKCKFFNKGLDNTQYMIFIQCTGGGSAYHFGDNLKECWFEHPFGGIYKSLSGQNITVDGCACWDVQSGQGVTQGNSLYYFGAAAGNAGSQATRITGCSRNLNGPDGATTWDVECESTSAGVQVENYFTSPLNPATTYNVFFNFHGCQDVVLLNNQSPQGAAVNGNSTTVVTSPSPNMVTVSKGLVLPEPGGVWTALDNGYLAYTFDPGLSGGATGPGTGVIQLARVNVRAQISVTNIVMYVLAGGTGLVTGQNFAGLYNPAGTQVGVTADQTTPWASGGVKTMALTSGPFTLTPGIYYVAVLSNQSAGATPTFARLNNSNATIANLGLATGGTWRSATNASGTALPGSITYSAGTVSAVLYFAGLT